MSSRYPFGMSIGFPQRVVARRAGVRDAFGVTKGFAFSDEVPARLSIRMVEVVENGMRAERPGIEGVIVRDDLAIGDEVVFRNTSYSIISLSAEPDSGGVYHVWKVKAVVKPGVGV